MSKFDISNAMTIKLDNELPDKKEFKKGIRRAPKRELNLSKIEIGLAIKNALRYIPEKYHEQMAEEFLDELLTKGRIYGYRYRPAGNIKARSVNEYKGKIIQGKALQLMIDNNLDFDIALYPYELTTYGETGQVCQNWMQYCLIKKYLEQITEYQTLVVASGHPVGLFPSKPDAPRVISTNGLLVGMFDDPDNFNRAASLGVSNYGQMTAGGWMYIGPQGIVHGTYITLLNAGRKYLNIPENEDLKGKVYVSSGLGGMSGAQPKAAEIAGAVSVTAEVDKSRIETRKAQGWVSKYSSDLTEIVKWIKEHKEKEEAVSIGYLGNIVDLWEYFVKNNIHIDLGSDQTSCHNVYEGGYTPAGISFDEGRELLKNDPKKFKELVNSSLIKHFELIEKMVNKGMFFWDYGNSFMKSVFDAGCLRISKNGKNVYDGFIFPSYVEDIMGPICFDYGYGPFRWVCLSGRSEDLKKTDNAAAKLIDPNNCAQDRDNYIWIKNAFDNDLVVGSQARILYSNAEGRVKIALKFNDMVRNGEIGPVMLGRDHHDVSGTDSPFRETSNIKDGSNICADMAVHCFAGDAARGMTLVVESNGGGVGIGNCFNGGFGMVLDGTEQADNIIRSALDLDVMGGVARRNWARNNNAVETAIKWNHKMDGKGHITIPYIADEKIINDIINKIS